MLVMNISDTGVLQCSTVRRAHTWLPVVSIILYLIKFWPSLCHGIRRSQAHEIVLSRECNVA